jgi:hypothetical protein
VWEKLGVSKAQQEYCRRGTCRTPFGQMMNGVVSPFNKLSGGLIPPFCPTTPSLAELQDPGAVGAAAKIKQDRAGAEERIKAVRYMGTVDCHYWPEAEEALIAALRNDRNECVRYEAAVVLGKGCCCTPKVIIALSNAVACSTADGGFMEKSARVRTAAQAALEHCMPEYCACPDITPLNLDGDKNKKGGGGGEVKPMSYNAAEAKPGPNGPDMYDNLRGYYSKVGTLPKSDIVKYATQAMGIGSKLGTVDTAMNVYDLQAAGVPLKAEGQMLANSPRPKNLWDAMTGGGTQTPTMAYAPMAVTARKETMTTTPTTVVTMPRAVVQTPEPPIRKTLVGEVTREKTPVMVNTPAPAPTMKPTVTSMVDPKPTPMSTVKPTPAPVPVVAPTVVRHETPAPVAKPAPAPTMAPVVTIPVTPAPLPAMESMVPVTPRTMPVQSQIPEEPVGLRPAIPARR